MSAGAVLATCNGSEPRGREVQARPKEGGKAMEEDALIRGPEGVCKPASPPILPPGKDSLGAPLPPPCSAHPAWSHRGKVMLLHHGKIYSCAEGTNNIPYLPTLYSRGLQLQQQQSTFPSMPTDFIEQSKAIGRQRLCPGRSPRSWGCRVGTGLRGEEKEGGSPWL